MFVLIHVTLLLNYTVIESKKNLAPVKTHGGIVTEIEFTRVWRDNTTTKETSHPHYHKEHSYKNECSRAINNPPRE